MYLLTFCVRFLLPECHQRKPAVQATAVMLRTAPRRRPITGEPATLTSHIRRAILRTPHVTHHLAASSVRRPRPAGRSHYVVISRDARKLVARVRVCCHSNTTRAPIANPPNSAQLGGSLCHAPKLHPDPCSIAGVRPRTDRQAPRQTDTQTDTQTRVTTIHFASSTTHAKCNKIFDFKHHFVCFCFANATLRRF